MADEIGVSDSVKAFIPLCKLLVFGSPGKIGYGSDLKVVPRADFNGVLFKD